MNCKYCGAGLEDGATVCPICGKAQTDGENTEEMTAAEDPAAETTAAEVSSVSDGAEADGRESFLQWLLHHGWTVSISLFALLLAVLGFLLLKRRAETLDGKN